MNNLVLTLAITTQFSLDDLGAFNLPFVIYLAALGMHRAFIVETILASSRTTLLKAARRLSMLSALAITLIVALVAAVVDNKLILLVALSLPALLLLDLHRNWAFREKKPFMALLMDSIWLAGTATLFLFPPNHVFVAVGVWSCSGAVGLLIGFLNPMYHQTEQISIKEFLVEAKGLAVPSVIDSLLYQVAWQLPVAIGLNTLSASTAGAYRLSTTIMAPLLVVVNSWNVSTFFTLRAAKNKNRALLHRTGGIALISLSYVAVVSVGVFVAQNWQIISLTFATTIVLLLVAAQTPLVGINSQIVVWHKVHRLGYRVLACRVLASIPLLAVVIWGATSRNSYLVAGSVVCGLLLYQLFLIVSYRHSRVRKAIRPIDVIAHAKG